MIDFAVVVVSVMPATCTANPALECRDRYDYMVTEETDGGVIDGKNYNINFVDQGSDYWIDVLLFCFCFFFCFFVGRETRVELMIRSTKIPLTSARCQENVI